MNLDLSGISAYLVILLLVVISVIDRFWLVRGRLTIDKVDHFPTEAGMIRFAVYYCVHFLPMWSEIRYSLVDKNNPTTVISGKTRGLDFSKRGANAEFLLIRDDIVNGGEWELKIKVVTMAGRLNPLYSLFPVQTFHTQTVEVVK